MDTSDSCCSTSWSFSDTSTPSSRIAVTKRKLANPTHYLRGKARAPFKSPSLGNTLSPLTPIASSEEQQSRVNACSRCSPVLYTLIPAFQAAGMHGSFLHNCHVTPHTQKGQDQATSKCEIWECMDFRQLVWQPGQLQVLLSLHTCMAERAQRQASLLVQSQATAATATFAAHDRKRWMTTTSVCQLWCQRKCKFCSTSGGQHFAQMT